MITILYTHLSLLTLGILISLPHDQPLPARLLATLLTLNCR